MVDVRLAIMQPYLFPYIGYFQLIEAVDLFVIYDDVNFINRGWINRNRILVNQEPRRFTIPCVKASQNKQIREVGVNMEEKTVQKLLRMFSMAYANAPFFKSVYPIVEETLREGYESIAGMAEKSIKLTCEYIGIDVDFKRSSESYNNRQLTRAERLIDICKEEAINNYVNPEGGREIYTKEYFAERGVNLSFIMTKLVPYQQFTADFFPGLSIIDVMMFNDPQQIREEQLSSYELA